MDAPAPHRPRPDWLWPALAALLYGGLHLLAYWQTPLGRFPVLDERENLDLAIQIANGALPAEPFYRAMAYPLVLAFFPLAGVPVPLLPFFATGLGLLLHVANTVLVAILARRLFGTPRAALIAGLLHALHPVLLFYATQIQDGTLATTAFLAGLLAILGRPDPTPAPSFARAALAGFCWSLAALTRPQLLCLLPVLPIVWIVIHGRHRPRAGRLATLAAAALAPWLALGVIQLRLHGEFRLLPTQGPYNLWAANRPGADGRYFVQTLPLEPGKTHVNPALAESLLLFARETGLPPADATLDAANHHWRRRLHAAIRQNPGEWLRLLGRKTVYLFANFDAYNNKTYAFHRARSPWLRPNPLGWGLLLAVAPLGFVALWRRERPAAAALALVASAIAAVLVLTFVSGRFRLPLACLLCISAGGLAAWRTPPPRMLAATLALGLLLGALSLSDPLGARDERTFLQDHLLSASAALRAGDDHAAWAESAAALRLAPAHADALSWRLVSGLNRLLADDLPADDEAAWLAAARRLLALPAPPLPARTAAGLALWRVGETDAARRVWHAASASDPEARAALALVGTAGLPTALPASAPPGPLATLASAWGSRATSPTDETLRALARRVFRLPATPPPASTPPTPPANPPAAPDNARSAR